MKTFSPYLNSYESDADSEFTLDYEMTSSPASPANGSITFDKGANIITATGYSSDTPCTFNDIWNADKAGERVLMADASAVQDMNLATQVLPTDSVALKLRFVVSGFVSNGFVNVTGTDKDGNAQTETNIAITANGNYSTSLWFATVSTKGLDCNGSYGIAVYQLQWGVVWKQGTNQYAFDCRIVVGDGTTATYLTDTEKHVIFTTAITDDTYFLSTLTGAVATFGIKASTNLGYAGCAFIFKVNAGGNYPRFGNSAGRLNLYGCYLAATIADTYSNCQVYGNSSSECYCSVFGQCVSFNTFLGTVNRMTVLKCVGIVSSPPTTINDITIAYGPQYATYFNGASPASVTISNGVFTSNAKLVYFNWASTILYLVNPVADSWTFTFSSSENSKVYRQYTLDLSVFFNNNTALENANVTLSRYGQGSATIGSWLTNSSGQVASQTLSMGCYNQTGGDTIYDYNPYNLTITKEGYQTYTANFTLSQKTNWTIALQPLTDGGLIEHQGFVPVDPGLTSPSGTYRWLDVADQAYGIGYRNSYNYSQAAVEVAYCTEGNKLQGLLKARNLKPNFAYQLKLVGTPGTADNERIGLAGRWWQEEWTGTTWANGQNLNDKGDGSSPNPNDQTYLSRRYIQDSSSPTGYHYRYTGYLVFNYFITDSNGTTTLQFETGSCYHVIWKTTQRSNATNDGPVKTVTFDPAPSQPAYDTDYPSNTVSIFGEWERLPMGQVNLQPGEYNCQILLTEESFHGSGGTLAGNWAGAVTANIMFTIN